MSSAAMSLIRAVRERGGAIAVQGGSLVIEPAAAGEPMVDALRAHKAQIIAILQAHETGPEIDPDAWREDFEAWIVVQCTRRAGRQDSCAVRALLLDFSDWTLARDGVPCPQWVLEWLLNDTGLEVVGGMVSGLVLRGDLWALEWAERDTPPLDIRTLDLHLNSLRAKMPTSRQISVRFARTVASGRGQEVQR